MGIVKLFSTNSNELTEAVKLALPGLRYEPALRDGKPVRQLVRYRSTVSTMPYVTSSSAGSSSPPSSMRRPNCQRTSGSAGGGRHLEILKVAFMFSRCLPNP